MAGVDDTWAFVPIGYPFPSNPVRVMGENNLYVALWYKHGVPVCGRGWNNGGVVECSFPWNGRELTGVMELGGEIQILTYTGDYSTNGYFYEWVPLKHSRQPHLHMVRCGDSAPIFKMDGAQLGNLCISIEMASFSRDGVEEKISGDAVTEMLVICRNGTKTRRRYFRSEENRWTDVNESDPVPPEVFPAPFDDYTFVALWFKENHVVMGRCWSENGRLSASFGFNGKEIRKDIGSFQYAEEVDTDYELEWRPLKDARGDGWTPVHVENVAPCVVKDAKGTERLGKVMLAMKPEVASAAWDNKEQVFRGPKVQTFLVLCRKRRPKPQGDLEEEEEPDVEAASHVGDTGDPQPFPEESETAEKQSLDANSVEETDEVTNLEKANLEKSGDSQLVQEPEEMHTTSDKSDWEVSTFMEKTVTVPLWSVFLAVGTILLLLIILIFQSGEKLQKDL